MTHKFTPLTIMLATALTLVACGSSDDAGNYSSPMGIEDKLQGTDYECETWNQWDDDSGSCDMGTRGLQHIGTEVSNPALHAAVRFDDPISRTSGVIIGDDWYFKCSGNLERAGCEEVRDIIGGRSLPRTSPSWISFPDSVPRLSTFHRYGTSARSLSARSLPDSSYRSRVGRPHARHSRPCPPPSASRTEDQAPVVRLRGSIAAPCTNLDTLPHQGKCTFLEPSAP